MKLSFDISNYDEVISKTVELSWKVAHLAETRSAWDYRWKALTSEISGQLDALIWWLNTSREEYEEIREAIWLLRDIANIHYVEGFMEEAA